MLSVRSLARILGLGDERVLDLIRVHDVPALYYDERTLVDADAFERFARRELGEAIGDAIRNARGGASPGSPTAPTAATSSAPRTPSFDPRNMEELVRAALEAHDGGLSYPLFRKWCERNGVVCPDIGTVRRHLGVSTWNKALQVCGGRRGVTTPERRAQALATIRRALSECGDPLRLDDYRIWAAANAPVGFRDGQRTAQAAGFQRWLEACAAARLLEPSKGSKNAA